MAFVAHRRAAGEPAVRVRQVERGQPVHVRRVDRETGIGHVQRSEHVLGEEGVQRLARGDLDDPAQHLGADPVVPLGAGLEEQRQAGPRGAGRGEVHPARRVELEALGAVHLVHRAGVVEPVGQPGGVGEQVPDPDRLDRGHGGRGQRRTSPVHPQVGELRDEPRDRVGQLQEPALVEHQRGDRGDRLGHRVDAPERVVGHRAVGLQVGPAVVGEQRHPAAPGHRDRPAGEPPVVDIGPEVPLDPLQPVRVEPDLLRIGVHLQLRHDTDPTPT